MSISCQPFPKIKETNYPTELSLGYRVPVGNPNFPCGCNSKQTEEKGKSILEMSKIFLAAVLWKSICAFVSQTACLLCVQTQDKHHLSACSAPALTSGHFHYSSLKTTFLWVFLQSYKMRMFAFKSGATWGFPGGAVVKNPPANAGDTRSSPGLGRSHMPRSNWAREPQLLSLCSTAREAAIVRGLCTAMKSGPRLPQLEKALAQKRRPNTAKNK